MFPKMMPVCVEDIVTGITAPAAYWVLDSLGHTNDSVYYRDEYVRIKKLVQDDLICWLDAIEVGPVCFWGGPPNKLAWYKGTLASLLMDRILDYYTKNSLEALSEVLCLNVS